MDKLLRMLLVSLLPVLLTGVGAALVFAAMRSWHTRQKKEVRQSPLTRNFLRSPGHSLRLKLEGIETDISAYFTMLLVAPFFLTTIHLSQSYLLGEKESPFRWVVFISVMILFSCFVVKRLLRSLQERKIAVLGLEGELATGEELNQLMLEGCRVFHDIPYRWGNIDHVVVSQSGVRAVNSKMLGKPKQNGTAEVTVDHQSDVIQFPDRTYRIPVDQLEREAKWLSQYLTSAVAEKIDVEPMLALPGWYVKERIGRSSVYVFNPIKPMKFFVQSREILSDNLIERVAHQLEQVCRDVEPSFRENPEW